MYIDENMIKRIKKDLQAKKNTEIERKSVFYSYLNRKGYEFCRNDTLRRIGRCERDIENYNYLEYIIDEIEKIKLHNLDTLTQQKVKVCVKLKDYSEEN